MRDGYEGPERKGSKVRLPTEYSSCTGKNRYETYIQAKIAADFAEKERNVNLSIYRCFYCETYHLSKKEL
jgi:hypothetical protein